MIPRATYRLQLSNQFGFDHAAQLVPYLHRLGVSHAYLSPYLKARPGSPRTTASAARMRARILPVAVLEPAAAAPAGPP